MFGHVNHVKPVSLFTLTNEIDRRLINQFFNLQRLVKYEINKKSNNYNDKIKLNHKTKILNVLNYLNKTNPDFCEFATESYSNLF